MSAFVRAIAYLFRIDCAAAFGEAATGGISGCDLVIVEREVERPDVILRTPVN